MTAQSASSEASNMLSFCYPPQISLHNGHVNSAVEVMKASLSVSQSQHAILESEDSKEGPWPPKDWINSRPSSNI